MLLILQSYFPQVYSEKIQNIVSSISQLTLVEVADLNQLLKKTLNIPDAPVMAVGAGMPMAAAAPQVSGNGSVSSLGNAQYCPEVC